MTKKTDSAMKDFPLPFLTLTMQIKTARLHSGALKLHLKKARSHFSYGTYLEKPKATFAMFFLSVGYHTVDIITIKNGAYIYSERPRSCKSFFMSAHLQ